MTDLSKMSDDEIDAILRRAENMDVPGSLFQRAKIERQIRDGKSRGAGSIIIKNSSGTITNSRFRNVPIDIQESSVNAVGSTFENDVAINPRPSLLDKLFWPVVTTIIASLLVAPIIYFFGWN